MRKTSLLFIALFLTACSSKEKQETVDKTSYRKAIIQNKIHFANCYKELASRDPEAHGKLVMTFSVDPKAQVQNIAVEKEASSLADENFIGCMTDTLKKVEFEAAPKGLFVDIKYPFVFLKPAKK